MSLPSILDAAHCAAAEVLTTGDVAVDATVGNGHDTLFLARSVGAAGHVYGIDIQDEALRSARERLKAAGVDDRVTLIEGGHEDLRIHLPNTAQGAVGSVMFNLGYLPGSDSEVVTRPETTCAALDAACRVLRVGGRITAVVYTGHDGGKQEAEAVEQWAQRLGRDRFTAVSYSLTNRPNNPPRLVVVEKCGAHDPSTAEPNKGR